MIIKKKEGMTCHTVSSKAFVLQGKDMVTLKIIIGSLQLYDEAPEFKSLVLSCGCLELGTVGRAGCGWHARLRLRYSEEQNSLPVSCV